jgi:hypothetical protein
MSQLTATSFDISPAASGWLTPGAHNHAALRSLLTAAMTGQSLTLSVFRGRRFPSHNLIRSVGKVLEPFLSNESALTQKER